ncbi:MAG: GNAT family N-acetyltransferase [Desulfobacterales bacterium]|nr:MAG: GNAT family N-acetyltransferase [Desulfobacterales bacterium]
MTKFTFTIRNYRPDDFENYVRLQAEAEAHDRCGRYVSAQAVMEFLNWPNFFPQKNLFLAETAKNLIGFISVFLELEIGRAVSDVLVHPRHRRKGVASQLFARALGHAREAGARVIQVCLPEADRRARNWASRLNLQRVRRFLEMRLDIRNRPPPPVERSGFTLRLLQVGEEDQMTAIQNRSFAGTWGFKPNTTEEITYRLNLGGRCPEDVVMAYAGDNPVGYCWTTVNPEKNAALKEKKGQIHMLGVDPDCLQMGLGKEILLVGLARLQHKGIEVVELTVDSNNQAARALYESVGFEVCANTLWFEKKLN